MCWPRWAPCCLLNISFCQPFPPPGNPFPHIYLQKLLFSLLNFCSSICSSSSVFPELRPSITSCVKPISNQLFVYMLLPFTRLKSPGKRTRGQCTCFSYYLTQQFAASGCVKCDCVLSLNPPVIFSLWAHRETSVSGPLAVRLGPCD